MWQHSPVPSISTTLSVFLSIFCHQLPHSFSSWCCTILQSRIQSYEPKQGRAPTAPNRSLTCVSAALLRQPRGYRTPLCLLSVLMQSAMERHLRPFIHPPLSVQLFEVFLFLSRVIMVTKLISYTERALSGEWRRQEAAAHFSHDGLGDR